MNRFLLLLLVIMPLISVIEVKAQWQQVNLDSNGTVGADVLNLTGSGSKVFAEIKGPSIFVSTNYGSTWNAAADSGLGSGYIQQLTITGTGLYAVTDSGIFLSSNNGTNWSSINGGVMDTVYPFSLIQSGSNLVVSTEKNGIYYSSNNGASWENVSGFDPQLDPLLSVIGSHIFSESANGMYLSSDNGKNWIQLNDFSSNGEGYYVGIVSSDSTLFAVSEPVPLISDPLVSSPGYLCRSTDNGKTWYPVTTTGVPLVYFFSPIYSLVTYGSDIFLVFDNVVFASSDDGNNWNDISDGLPSSEITAFFVNDSSIFAGIYGSGIWRLPLSDIITAVKQPTLPSSPKSFVLWQNYPNPFNPSTIIGYDIPNLSHVTMNVYDVLGRKVETLVDNEKLPGHYQVTFNASRLPSGVYFYRLTAGSFVQTKKLIVIK